MKHNFLIRVISLIAIPISFWFIAERFLAHQHWLRAEFLHKEIIIIICICSIIYGTSELLLSIAWRQLLILCGQKCISQQLCHTIYGKTQLAKYIPGNIFHFSGRHLLGNAAGISHRILTSAAIYEILGLLTISGIIGCSGIILLRIENTYLSVSQITGIIFIAILLSIVVTIFVPYFIKARDITLPQLNIWLSICKLWTIYFLYSIFFLNAGLLLVLIINTFVVINLFIAIKVITVFSIAWLAGFVVPGAPGGIGVREAVIIYSIAPIIGEAQAVAAAIALRLVTIFGDIWFFIISEQKIHKQLSRK